MPDIYSRFQQTTLSNGLTVCALQVPDCTWQRLGFVVHVGSRDDPKNIPGLSHFLEHVVSANAPMSFLGVQDWVNRRGGDINLGETSSFGTRYSCQIPAEEDSIRTMLHYFGSMLLHAETRYGIRHERPIIQQEYQLRFNPGELAIEMQDLQHLYWFEGTFRGLRSHVIGTPSSITAIQRADLQDHYDRYYVPANITVVGVGALGVDELSEYLCRSPFTGSDISRSRNSLPDPIEEIFPSSEINSYLIGRQRRLLNGESVDSAGWYATTVMPGTISYAIMFLLKDILTDALFKKLREERKLLYGIECDLETASDLHYMTIVCDSFKPEIEDEFEDLVDDIMWTAVASRKNLRRAQTERCARNEMQDNSGEELLEGAMGDFVGCQRLITLTEDSEATLAVTLADIQDAFSAFAPNWRFSVLRSCK